MIDTDCDPDDVDLPIPGNDDGIRSIEIILSHLSDAVIAGAKNVKAKNEGADAPKEGGAEAAADAGAEGEAKPAEATEKTETES